MVIETAAISIQPKSGGPERLVIFLITSENDGNLKERMQGALSEKLNPLFKIFDVIIVDQLPRTSTNKLMRRSLRMRLKNFAN